MYENERAAKLLEEKTFFADQKPNRDALASRAKDRIKSPVDNSSPKNFEIKRYATNKFFREKSAENKKAMFAKRPSMTLEEKNHNFPSPEKEKNQVDIKLQEAKEKYLNE